MISEKLKTDTLEAFCSLGASAALSCETEAPVGELRPYPGLEPRERAVPAWEPVRLFRAGPGQGQSPARLRQLRFLLFHRPFAFPPSYLMA